jgi:hypothetical protein
LNELPSNDQINEKIIKNTIDHVGVGTVTTEAGGMGRLKKADVKTDGKRNDKK